MNVKELYDFFDALIPRELSCEWDNDGLMCASDLTKKVKKVLLTLDVSEAAVDYAIKNSFDAIISHHPLIFNPVKSIREDRDKKLVELIKNDVAVMSFHTRLDAMKGGMNDRLADLLSLSDTYPFGPEGETVGRIGTTEREYSPKEFALKIKYALCCENVLVSDAGKNVKKVAVVGGDGKDYMDYAVSEGADTYISGRLGYNTMAEAKEMGINLIEAGHFYTEDHICDFFKEKIALLDKNIYTEHFCSNVIKII